MNAIQQKRENFELAGAIKSVFVFVRRSCQIDFMADRPSGTPVVFSLGIGWTMLQNGTPPIRRDTPRESLPIRKCFQSIMLGQQRCPCCKRVSHECAPTEAAKWHETGGGDKNGIFKRQAGTSGAARQS